MSASIRISGLSWSTPDGRAHFSHLDLSFGAERAGFVGRNGVGKTTLLKFICGELAAPAGTVAVNGRVRLLRQNVQARPGETIAGLFGANAALSVLRRAEAGLASPEELAAADWTLETRIAAALARVGLEAGTGTALATLSGGQITRAGLAALVFDDPDFLLLDEPTNNLDREGRTMVMDLVGGWRAGAIVVSHDRELLDRMDAIVELTSLGARRYGGNWSHYHERKAVELAAAQHDLDDAERRVAETGRKMQATAERQARRDKAGRKMAAKGDMPKILLGGMKDRSEKTGGENARLGERRMAEAQEAAAGARERVEVLQPMLVAIPATGLPARRSVLSLEGVTVGYDRPIIRDLTFSVTGPERIAITGPNGSGKTTLLALIAGTLPPWSGRVRVVVAHALLDQQVSVLDLRASIRDNFRRLNPDSNENAARAALARFKFRAEAALQIAGELSGGQILRAGLACVLGSAPPPLLMLDEPTNHLDIDSIEAVEAGLRAYDGALVVVSHDEAFLAAIGITRRIALQNNAN